MPGPVGSQAVKKHKKGKSKGGNPAKARAKLATQPSPVTKPRALPLAAQRARPASPRPATTAVAARYSNEERHFVTLLLAPFLIVAASLAGQQALRYTPAMPPPPAIIASAERPLAPPTTLDPSAEFIVTHPTVPRVSVAPVAPPNPRLASAEPIRPDPAPIAPAPIEVAPAPLPRTQVARALPKLKPIVTARPADLTPPLPIEAPEHTLTAALTPPPLMLPAPTSAAAPVVPASLDPLAVARAERILPQTCEPNPGLLAAVSPAVTRPPARTLAPTAFGLALADAARSQTGDLVIYNGRYTRIPYPGGDVSPLFGVCTDVVVRAYRSLGIDLQELIQVTRSGRGDPHIDHRRVEVVRRFLATHGEPLPVTDIPEDYRPGDIVTYYRPQNRTSTSHIAIVSNELAPSGRPMLIHNRGWGPQLEDALFVDKITGHFRFRGLPPKHAEPVTASIAGFAKTAIGAAPAQTVASPGRAKPMSPASARSHVSKPRSAQLSANP